MLHHFTLAARVASKQRAATGLRSRAATTTLAACTGRSISERKTERLAVRVTSDDKRTIERAAALSGQSVSSFVSGHARDAAERIVERHGRIRLNAGDSKRFVEGLLAPAREVPKAAKDAFEDYRQTVREVTRSHG
jgi:uncharacterized protein (DUF1778 family)